MVPAGISSSAPSRPTLARFPNCTRRLLLAGMPAVLEGADLGDDVARLELAGFYTVPEAELRSDWPPDRLAGQ